MFLCGAKTVLSWEPGDSELSKVQPCLRRKQLRAAIRGGRKLPNLNIWQVIEESMKIQSTGHSGCCERDRKGQVSYGVIFSEVHCNPHTCAATEAGLVPRIAVCSEKRSLTSASHKLFRCQQFLGHPLLWFGLLTFIVIWNQTNKQIILDVLKSDLPRET